MTEIKPGSHVHHPQHGIGKVESIRKRRFSGQAAATYAQVYFEREDLTLITLAEAVPQNIRNLISSDEARELLDKLKNWRTKPKAQWKARVDAHQRAIESGDPFEYAKVVKGLSLLAAESELNHRDQNQFNHSLELLNDELARALKRRPAKTRELIMQAVNA
ncbi:MAG: hypothetical protein HKP03_05790 [Xanthomonadales bacterium]|nr:hypothetical protein [Xanthomonadales bacterium]NNK37971.1 hypothetical protein [Xanthomonadales bacterium]